MIRAVQQRLLRDQDGVSAPDLRRVVDGYLYAASNQAKNPDEPSDYPRLLASGRLERDRLAYGDTLIAAVICEAGPITATEVTRVLLILGLLEWLDGHRTASSNQVSTGLSEAAILLPPDLFGTLPVTPGPPPGTPQDVAAPLFARARQFSVAGDAVRALANESIETRIQRIPSQAGLRATGSGDDTDGTEPNEPDDWRLTAEKIASLSPEVREALEEALVPVGAPIQLALNLLRQQAEDNYSGAVTATADNQARTLAIELARRFPASMVDSVNAFDLVPGPFVRPPAIGDLNVVRQTLLRYQRGEVAHIENVLAKEAKKRAITVADLREEESINVREDEEERSFDNQTTARNELEKETTKTQQDDEKGNVGGSVSAQYGPWVKATVTAGYTKGGSTSESVRNAARYAKEVTDRSASRIRQRTEEFQRSLTRHEVTERNSHALTNSGAQHLSGIYRWVNKLYRAQVFNYGKRLLLELVIPDPSVYFRYGAAKGSGLSVGVEPPPPLALPETPDDELQPSMITAYNWSALAARFKVSGITPPPSDLATVTMGLVGDQAPPAADAPPPASSGASGANPHPAPSSNRCTKRLANSPSRGIFSAWVHRLHLHTRLRNPGEPIGTSSGRRTSQH